MKNRASLLKTLTRFEHCTRMCLDRIENDATWTLNSGDMEEWAQTCRQIAKVQLGLLKLSRELTAASRQIRAQVESKGDCLEVQAPEKARSELAEASELNRPSGQPRSAFAALATEKGAVLVRVLEGSSGVWPQKEYGCFETWTQAQGFAGLLNQRYGIDPVEAEYIVVSASLALASSGWQHP